MQGSMDFQIYHSSPTILHIWEWIAMMKKNGAASSPQMNEEEPTQGVFQQLLIVSSHINHDRKYL